MAQGKTIRLLPLTDEEAKTLKIVLNQLTSNTCLPSNFEAAGITMFCWLMDSLKSILEKLEVKN